MKKNVASQVVGAQLIAKADGSDVTTGTTTVYVTGDGGTQATGSVGSGAATHEGNGFWTYTPAQAETNYDHVVFQFKNTNAVTAAIQIYPSFPQTGDNYARLGAPAGASVSADLAAVKTQTASIETKVDTIDDFVDTEVAAIKTKTDFLPSVTAGAAGGLFIAGSNAATTVNFTGNVSGSVGSVTGAVGSVTGNVGGNVVGSVASVASGGITAASFAANAITAAKLDPDVTTELQAGLATASALTTVAGYIDTEVAAIKAKTDNLPSDPADASDVAAAFSTVNSTLGTIAGYLDTEVAAIKAKTDLIPSDPAETSDIPTAAAIADAVWDEAIAGHAGAGSTGEALSAAGAGGDPWVTALPGSYTAGQAGYILANRASQASVDDVPTNAELATALAAADDAVLTAINDLPTNAELATALGTADDAVLTAIGDLPTNAELATALGTSDDAVLAAVAALSVPTVGAIATELLDTQDIETGISLRESIRGHNAVLMGKASGMGTTNGKFRNLADNKDVIDVTQDADGNRTAITRDLT